MKLAGLVSVHVADVVNVYTVNPRGDVEDVPPVATILVGKTTWRIELVAGPDVYPVPPGVVTVSVK